MSQEFRVNKHTLPVFVLLREMDPDKLWQGEVFQHEHSEWSTAAPALEDLMNTSEKFVPLQFQEGGFSLVNKDNIIYMQTRDFSMDGLAECGIEPQQVKIFFKENHFLQGEIYPELPDDRRRPLDFFNQGLKFLPVYQEQTKWVVNVHHILYVQDN